MGRHCHKRRGSVATNIKQKSNGSSNKGVISLSTISASTLLINPNIRNTKEKEAWEFSMENLSQIETNEVLSIQEGPQEILIRELIETPLANFKHTYCYFKARIDQVTNIAKPWYNACKKCRKKVTPTDHGIECAKCKNSNAEYQPRYLMRLIVTDGTKRLMVTLFEAAETITGYLISEFLNNKDEEIDQQGKEEKLRNTYGKTFRFILNVDRLNEKERTSGKIIAEEVQADEVNANNSHEKSLEFPLNKKIKIEKED